MKQNRPMATLAGRSMKIRAVAALGALGLALAGCSRQAGPPPAVAPPPVPVTVAAVEVGPVPVQLKAIGTVRACSSVLVKPQVNGKILKRYFAEGDRVPAGQLLFSIDPAPFEAVLQRAEANLQHSRANLLRDQALARNAEADVKRYAELVAKDYVTRQQYDTVVANADALKATLMADEAAVRADEASIRGAKLDLDYCSIYAPIGGRVGDILVYPGNIVKLNDTGLVNIYEVQPIYVDFPVPEQYLTMVREYLRIKPLEILATIPDTELPAERGRLTFLDSIVDSDTGTLRLRGTFDNERGVLWPGQFVETLLTLTVEENALYVPAHSVQVGQAGQFVFVVDAADTAATRPVTVSRTVGERSVVSRGLKAGERVVTDGQLRLVTGSKVVIREEAQAEKPRT